jgi:pimeloyl-ACP methyl ester carboxylesterase
MLTTTSADGTEVRATDQGQGPVILIVHPGLDDGRSWDRVAARLAGRFRVVRPHRRRYRLDLTGDPPCSIAQEATDVLAVAEEVGEPVLLVGHSSGAVVALEALVASPAAFGGAVLYEPPLVIGPSLGGDSPAVQRAQAAVAAGRPGRAMAIFLRDIVQLHPLEARLAGVLVAIDRRLRALAPRQIDDVAAINQLGVRLDAYAAIDVPVVLLGGDRSPTHLGERLDALAAVLPHAERVVLHDQGHDAHRNAPEEVARVVETLADKVLRQPGPPSQDAGTGSRLKAPRAQR